MASSSLNEVRRVGAVMELRTVLERVGMLLASVGLVGVDIFFFFPSCFLWLFSVVLYKGVWLSNVKVLTCR